jgi:dTDP-4-dehydrorhamnose reductase
MRVLVLGATGMLGHKLAHVLGADPGLRVHATVRRPPPSEAAAPGVRYHPGVGLSGGTAALAAVLRELAPDVVVNAVGAIKQKDLYAAIDEAFFLNGSLPHLLPLLNPNPAARVIHFSTDCVFRGDRGGYTEDDRPDVADLYGRSKACGEVDYGPHLTLRTSIVGWETGGWLGLLSWFLGHRPGDEVRGFTHAVFSGLPTVTLSRLVLRIIREMPELRGVYHAASEPIDKHDLLRRLNQAMGLGFRLVPDPSLRIDRSLDDTRLRRATGTTRPGWDGLVRELVDDFDAPGLGALYRTPAAAPAAAEASLRTE